MNIGFREIALIVVGYLIVRFIMGVRRARKTMTNFREQMENQMREAERAANPKQEGEITIDKSVRKERNNKLDDGEYVDFEEVD